MFKDAELKQIAAAHKQVYDALVKQLEDNGPPNFRAAACEAAAHIVAAKLKEKI